MSGGSYDYASLSMDLEDLLRNKTKLIEMSESILGLGYADDVVKLMQEMFLNLHHWEILAEMYCKKLGNVWHDYEWWRSGDYGEEQFKKALNECRTPKWNGLKHDPGTFAESGGLGD